MSDEVNAQLAGLDAILVVAIHSLPGISICPEFLQTFLLGFGASGLPPVAAKGLAVVLQILLGAKTRLVARSPGLLWFC